MGKAMKLILGLLLVIFGIALGLYVGGYLMVFKGIVGIIEGVKMGWIASMIAWGVVKILLASITGWLCALVLIIPGVVMVSEY